MAALTSPTVRRLPVLLASVVVLLAVAAPARAATLDTRSVRKEIAGLVQQTYAGLPAGNVACPAGLARKAGTTFACTVQLPGTFLVVSAEQVDGKGRVRLAARQAVLPRARVEQFVASQATVPATVACGTAAFIVLHPGQKFSCRATIADGSTRQVELVVRDVEGNVAITAVA